METKRFLLGIFLVLIVIIPFVLSAPAAPINLDFQDNTQPDYDEGVFNVVWESGGGELEIGYNIYIFQDESFLMVAPNTSSTGYSVNNPAEAKYSFIVEALNASNSGTNSSGNVSITVDSTSPTVSIIGYSDYSLKKNTELLELSIYTEDAGGSGLASNCLISIVDVDTLIPISNGWCNSTSVPLSGISDGNKSINVRVNDSAGNVRLNNQYFVWIDTSGPVISFECLPPNVNPNEEVTCNCTATDAGAGVNISTFQFSENPSTSEVGTFTRTCIVSDILGNANSETASYTVSTGNLYQGQDTNYSEENGSWIYTYSINENQFLQGYTQNLALKRRIEFEIGDETHHIGVLEVDNDSIKLEIASNPIEKILEIGEELKLDLLNDGFYDIYIILNGILNNNSANLTVRGIHESVSGLVIGENGNESLNSSSNQTGSENKQGFLGSKLNKNKTLIIGGIVLFLIIVFVLALLFYRKKDSKDSKPKGIYQSPSDNDSGESPEEVQVSNVSFPSDSVETQEVSEVSSDTSNLSGTSRESGKGYGSIDDIIKTHPDKENKPKTGQA